MRPMLTVHHLETSRSQRVLWLLEELGVAYDLKRYQRDPRTRLAPPELKRIHPLGKSPVIEDGGEVIAESGAIIEHIAERYGAQATGELAHLVPQAGTPERPGSTEPVGTVVVFFGFARYWNWYPSLTLSIDIRALGAS